MKTNDLHKLMAYMPDTSAVPALFVGHGTPMNAIENNEFSSKWQEIGSTIARPQAILCISAHWETRGTFVTAMSDPKTIHDFYGFPKELYNQQYNAKGFPQLANDIQKETLPLEVNLDYDWGLDHGAWSVLKHIYPKADIPVLQLSIDYTKDLGYHIGLAKELSSLRHKGILIIGSGNIIHNLRMMSLIGDDINTEYGYDWAIELNNKIKRLIEDGDLSALKDYKALSNSAQLGIPSLEHYIPMLYTLALRGENEKIELFNDKLIAGSLSMTSFMVV